MQVTSQQTESGIQKFRRFTFTLARLVAVVTGALAWSSVAVAFQIAPLGSAFESKLTNESEASLAAVAEKLGVLIKGRVHEEITQIGMGCPIEPAELVLDLSCSKRDLPFVTPYVIYGVRWNDLPPFRLSPGEGDCTYMGKSCNVSQTIRFSTQPLCWYCLFKDAERKSRTHLITGCNRSEGSVQGNVMTRSHFGDLQFLHAMAGAAGMHPGATRAEVMDWLEFAWKVFSREIKADTLLREIENPTLQAHFGCTEWRVTDLYLLGQQDKLRPYLHQVAFGSVLHTVQDSFADAHVSREAPPPGGLCNDTAFPHPGRVMEFHTYLAQDGGLHDAQDSRQAMTRIALAGRWPEAVEATRNLASFYEDRALWSEVQPYMQCLFELAEEKRQESSPGDAYRRR